MVTINDMTPPKEFKMCKSAESCIHPNGPVLPEYEFYTFRDGLYSICKQCKTKLSKKYRSKPKDIAGHDTEQLVINKLRSIGIYAAPGKSSEYKWVDVIAWGCIRIEVKSSYKNKNKGTFLFTMGKKFGIGDIRPHIVILLCKDKDVTFHVFNSNNLVFYHLDGRPKQGVCYNPHPKWRQSTTGITLDTKLMNESLNRWHLVEDVRKQIINEILSLSLE